MPHQTHDVKQSFGEIGSGTHADRMGLSFIHKQEY